MKKLLFIITIFLSINSYSQQLTGKATDLQRIAKRTVNDTIIKVIYKNEIENTKKPAYFINSKFVNKTIIKYIKPNTIENVKIEKGNFEIDNVKYYDKIIIETKENYKPKFISLSDFKLKHTNIKENSVVFHIDDELINADYQKFIIDENYILSVVIEKFENQSQKLNLTFIKLVTKTEENIKKANDIIRGGNELSTNE
ncbi:hypothetical protein [Flavobacterium sp.]|uniref:hypothetical protein n=1 Tax=Flavobacterium sp. TaxID=239 RepID=UPI00286EA565|nr:hypothetical protein [Flavobacterium sp.]